jgi:hypothetical protein
MSDSVRAAFGTQAQICRDMGSAFTAELLETLAVCLDETTQTGRAVLNWPGDPLADALKLRLTGGLHALARSGQDAELTSVYAARTGDLARIVPRVLADWDSWLLPWLESAPQTNEVGRSGALWPAVMAVAHRFGPQVELLELGASAGLNLNMDRFAYDLGGIAVGNQQSLVRLRPGWNGTPPAIAPVDVVARRGVDLNPLDVARPDVAARLLAYVWPDQEERLARIAAAIDLARAYPPLVDQADGADWIEARLAAPQALGVTRIVYHSIALQYFPPEGRARVARAMKAAGALATMVRPLAWLSMEFEAAAVSNLARLSLTCWPADGTRQTLAHVHPHGAAIDWMG